MATYNMRNFAPNRDNVPPPNWQGDRNATTGVGTGRPRSGAKARFEPDNQLRVALESFIGKLSTASLRDRNWAITSLRRSIAEFGTVNQPVKDAKPKGGKQETASNQNRKPGINKLAKSYPEYRALNEAYNAVKEFHSRGETGPQDVEERYSAARIAFEELKARLRTQVATEQLIEEDKEKPNAASSPKRGRGKRGRKPKPTIPLTAVTRSMDANKHQNPVTTDSVSSDLTRKRETELPS